MDKLLTAVEQGKSKLRLDYTPYGLLEGPKHWKSVKKPEPQVVKEVDEETAKKEKKDKRNKVADFMDRLEGNIAEKKAKDQ